MEMRHNFSLQRTAGLRFSQFVARWPAAAEFRCSVAAQLGRPMCAGVRAIPF